MPGLGKSIKCFIQANLLWMDWAIEAGVCIGTLRGAGAACVTKVATSALMRVIGATFCLLTAFMAAISLKFVLLLLTLSPDFLDVEAFIVAIVYCAIIIFWSLRTFWEKCENLSYLPSPSWIPSRSTCSSSSESSNCASTWRVLALSVFENDRVLTGELLKWLNYSSMD